MSITVPDVQRKTYGSPLRKDDGAEVETCSGRTSPFSRVRWWVVPDAHYFELDGQTYAGAWWPSHDIVLAGDLRDYPQLVRHEMLHDLLVTGRHPPHFFLERCGALLAPDTSRVP
jgi:hypothetical protein